MWGLVSSGSAVGPNVGNLRCDSETKMSHDRYLFLLPSAAFSISLYFAVRHSAPHNTINGDLATSQGPGTPASALLYGLT